MQEWMVLDNAKSPSIKYGCSFCGCVKTLFDISDRLPRYCPKCASPMKVKEYGFFVHRIEKENR